MGLREGEYVFGLDVPDEAYRLLIVFCRVGSIAMLMPAIGEAFISSRVRLVLALMISLLVAPVVNSVIPPLPATVTNLVEIMFGEIVIGLFIGTLMRTVFTILANAGAVIAYTGGFANATLFNPLMQESGALQSVLLSMLGLMLIFATDMHHVLIEAMVKSYGIFTPGAPLMAGDMADLMAHKVAESFNLGVQMASPFLVAGLGFYILLGLMARLMPQLQVFFIAMPIQIMMGLVVLSMTLPALLYWFMRVYGDSMVTLLGGG